MIKKTKLILIMGVLALGIAYFSVGLVKGFFEFFTVIIVIVCSVIFGQCRQQYYIDFEEKKKDV